MIMAKVELRNDIVGVITDLHGITEYLDYEKMFNVLINKHKDDDDKSDILNQILKFHASEMQYFSLYDGLSYFKTNDIILFYFGKQTEIPNFITIIYDIHKGAFRNYWDKINDNVQTFNVGNDIVMEYTSTDKSNQQIVNSIIDFCSRNECYSGETLKLNPKAIFESSHLLSHIIDDIMLFRNMYHKSQYNI